MRKILLFLAGLGVGFLLAICINRYLDSRQNADLQRLLHWMSGSFSSQAQAAADTNFYDIRLTMKQIWKHRKDGYWLYVEQAMTTNPDRPYRQRVYQLSQPDEDRFQSRVYQLHDPLRFAGKWMKTEPLADLSPDSLVERIGCDIILKKEGDSAFIGCTIGRNCESELRGAVYATSEVRITDHEMVSWDRGFDADGKQVWGAKTGGYIFRKTASF